MSKQIRVNKLIGSEDVKVEKDDYIGKYNLDAKSAQKWILDNLRGQYIIDDTQEYVEISRVGAEEVTSHSRHDDAHLKSISAILALLKNAIFIEEYEDVKKNGKFDSYRYYAVDVSGELCRVKVTLKHDRRDIKVQKAYSYEATSIEILDSDIKENRALAGQSERVVETRSRNSNSSISVAKLLKDVEKSHRQGEKLLNVSQVLTDDGHPLVVEHGTNNEFTVFDINKLGENSKDNGLFGAGFYFGTHAPAWLNAKHTMKVFLDIKHPFEVSDKLSFDIYSEIKTKLDTPAMLDLFRFQKVFRQHPSKG